MKLLKTAIWLALLACMLFNSVTSEVTGTAPHIISGCVFVVLAAAHTLLGGKYFIVCAKNLFSPKLKAKAKVNCLLDAALIISVPVIAATGIMLAMDVKPAIFNERHDLEVLHGVAAGCMFITAIIHGCLHIKKKSKTTKYREDKPYENQTHT